MNIVHSILLLGPSGTGKSSLAASAAAALGGAAIVGAPGDDEKNSYIHLLQDEAHYSFKGFDDTEWLPSIGSLKAEGLKQIVEYLRTLYKQVAADISAGNPPRFPLLILDTFSAMSQMAVNATQAKHNVTSAPPARGENGAPYYGTLRQKQDEVMRLARAIRGLGVHLIVTSHINERENISEAAAAVTSSKMLLPAISGGFRDVLPSFFDGVFYTSVKVVQDKPSEHWLQWRPSTKRPSKSRLGDLAANGAAVRNDWKTVRQLMDNAVAKRLTDR